LENAVLFLLKLIFVTTFKNHTGLFKGFVETIDLVEPKPSDKIKTTMVFYSVLVVNKTTLEQNTQHWMHYVQ